MIDNSTDSANLKPTRRAVIALGGLLAASAAVSPALAQQTAADSLAFGRPAPASRRFRSRAVDQAIDAMSLRLQGSELQRRAAVLFANCYPNTLDTTVSLGSDEGRPDTFVITGDIDAMWLRDSAAQIEPYLRFAREDAPLRRMIAGVINRQTDLILIDPYANAFNRGPTGAGWRSDRTVMKPEVFERKFEVDSLCYPVRLASQFWKATGDASCFDARWTLAAHSIVDTFVVMQRKTALGPYSFKRVTDRAQDTAPNEGRGAPTRPVGLIASLFRPSDDACVLPFLIPSNMMAVVALRQLAEIALNVTQDAALANRAIALADEVDSAIRQHAIIDDPVHGRIFAFEIDGYGSRMLLDDANAPSLLSAPWLGWCDASDPVYRATRAMALSDANPWYFRGRAAEGIGSLHTSVNRIWPLAIIMRGLTSTDDAEILSCIRQLVATDAGTGFMHEAFDKDDPAKFSRTWFAWANGLFGELLLKVSSERPALLAQL